ncbi:MAG TPA: hypothetical protein DCE56_12565, partial [Cyanobacteria bacterium UBA8553]|nr:hypothetical protein [Cyanobacteria bacterium UBA8553]
MEKLQPWYWRSLPLEHRTGSEVFDCLFRQTSALSLPDVPWAIATLLESPYPTPPDPSCSPDDLLGSTPCTEFQPASQTCHCTWHRHSLEANANGNIALTEPKREPLARYSICAGIPRRQPGY